MTLRLLSYNIRHGGVGRVDALARVIRDCAADVVVLQEATRPDVVRALSEQTALREYGSHRGRSLAYLSRLAVANHAWRRPLLSRHAFLELTLADHAVRIVGVHLSAVHAAWTERRRLIELESLLRIVRAREAGFHVLAGDFNTLAPGELLDARRLPPRLRPFVWLSGGSIRWRAVTTVLAAGYADAWRSLHADGSGSTFPTWAPHLRLDYVFVPRADAQRVVRCEVMARADAARASDHFPLLAELAVDPSAPRVEDAEIAGDAEDLNAEIAGDAEDLNAEIAGDAEGARDAGVPAVEGRASGDFERSKVAPGRAHVANWSVT